MSEIQVSLQIDQESLNLQIKKAVESAIQKYLESSIKTYTRKEVAEIIGMDIHNIQVLEQYGLLKGIKSGKSTLFQEKEVLRYMDEWKGYDMSNPQKIMVNATMKKKGSLHP